jgi:hypothetical protein
MERVWVGLVIDIMVKIDQKCKIYEKSNPKGTQFCKITFYYYQQRKFEIAESVQFVVQERHKEPMEKML